MVKRILKKVVKKISKKVKQVAEDSKFNDYGTCIACQGGNPDCLHNNLAQDGQNLVCVTCGKCMSCD